MKPRTLIITLVSIIIIAAAAIGGFIFLQNQQDLSVIDPETSNPSVTIPGDEPPYTFDYSWTTNNPYIAHAFGGILGDIYTNSYEAFLLNYQLGHRIFEVDFMLTEDGKMYAVHDLDQWRKEAGIPEDTPFTSENFASTLIDGKYHAVNLNQLVEFMKTHPDIYVVTDTKHTEPDRIASEFSQIVAAADASVLDRFIVQIYYPDMLAQVMQYYPWKSVIYTLYANPNWTPENVIEFAKASGVKIITIWEGHAKPEVLKQWLDSGLTVAIHTLNDLNTVDYFRSLGATIFYTDFLIP